MVKVREDHPVAADGEVDINRWLHRLEGITTLQPEGRELLAQACELSLRLEHEAIAAENVWAEGASSFRTGLEMAEILASLQLDSDSLVASVLYRAVRERRIELKIVEASFGSAVAKLIAGVQKMAAIGARRNDSHIPVLGQESDEQAEQVRKMLVAMVDDVRVALIKLAERTCAIRAVKNVDEVKRCRVAREVADVYAPLAHRLGIGHIKWELEDLSFRYLQPEEYKKIATLLDEKRLDRLGYIERLIAQLHDDFASIHIEADINGRAKHIYSIWRKMCRKGISFSQVYDIRAVRVLVKTERDCYSVLSIVHNLWRNISHEFDDYIAVPKENGYRSLHTAVVGPENKVLEIQIRTFAMHSEAEYGICAHWRYKGADSDRAEDSYEQKITWLRQVLEWHESLGDGQQQTDALGVDGNLDRVAEGGVGGVVGGIFEGVSPNALHAKTHRNNSRDHIETSVEQTRIYVFTPDGHIIDLPRGATPLDFAYRVHTDVGHRCRGAKVNGRIVPLNSVLETSDQVEIITGKRESPSRDWLTSALGYLATSKARASVQHWFKMQARDQNISEGQALLDREFKRLALMQLDFEQLAKKLNLRNLDNLYAAVGASDIGVGSVLNAAQKMLPSSDRDQLLVPFNTKAAVKPQIGADVYIDGVGNLMTQIAHCCNPLPGDAINGYITLGRGVSIHRQDCSNILQLQTEEPERIIQVSWGHAPKNHYSVELLVEAFDRQGLLRDITELLDRDKINITSMNSLSDRGENTVDMSLVIEVKGFTELSRVLARLNQLSNVASARRKKG